MKVKKRKFVEVFYDPEQNDFDTVIEQELKRLGLQHGQVTLICKPKKESRIDGRVGVK